MKANPRDNALTLIALGDLAFILADTTHEALGHGLATLAVGGVPVLLTSSYLSTSGHYSRWIPAAGGIANVIVGLIALVCTRPARKAAPSLLYFLILVAAFNLLFAAAYPFYSGVALFGDWASVIAGLAPAWVWRALLIVCSVSLYLLFLSLLAFAIRPFCGASDCAIIERLRHITLIHFCQHSSSPALPEFSTLRDGSTCSQRQRPPQPHPLASRSSTTSARHSPPIRPHRSPDPFLPDPHGSPQPSSPRSCLSQFSAQASTFTKVKAGSRSARLRPAV